MKDKFIPAALIERVNREIKLVDIVRDAIPLVRRGEGWIGNCPFHASSASTFRVAGDNSTFRCSSCRAEGDSIDFIRKLRGCSFREAVFSLCALMALTRAAEFYEDALWNRGDAQKAREHLRTRGIEKATSRKWQLGYAPAGWSNLLDALTREGLPIEALTIAGLVAPRQNGKGHYDRFRERLMVPIRKGGRVVAFGARALSNEEPKYLNSPETIYFKKSETLFGFDEASGTRCPVVVEGYFDAIALHQTGIAAVAVCGSVVNELHLEKLTVGGFHEMCFAFDGDQAGRDAAARAAALCLGSPLIATFLECPEDMDPDTLVAKEGTAAFRARLSGAKSADDLVIEDALREFTAESSIEAKVTALSRLAALFQSSKRRLSLQQVQRLAAFIGCDSSAMEKFLGERDLLPENSQGSAPHPGGLRP